MSTGGGKKGTGKGPPKKAAAAAEKEEAGTAKVAEKDADTKEDTTSSNGDKKELGKVDNAEPVIKPQSAGANTRDAAAKVLAQAQKGEWPAVESSLKSMEKMVAAGGEEVNTTPLAGVLDTVC